VSLPALIKRWGKSVEADRRFFEEKILDLIIIYFYVSFSFMIYLLLLPRIVSQACISKSIFLYKFGVIEKHNIVLVLIYMYVSALVNINFLD
jgi:hypothetical protein